MLVYQYQGLDIDCAIGDGKSGYSDGTRRAMAGQEQDYRNKGKEDWFDLRLVADSPEEHVISPQPQDSVYTIKSPDSNFGPFRSI